MSTITNVFSELSRLIDQVSKERGINKKLVIDSIVRGLLSAARKKYGTYRNIEVKYNEELGQLELYEFKEVVEDSQFVDDQIEIKLSEALKMDPEVRVKDQIGSPLKSEELGRIDAYMARQIVLQSLRAAENEMIFNEFEKQKGEIVSGVVRREDKRLIVVNLDKVEAYIPQREQIRGERYQAGDRIQGYVLEVQQNSRGPQIIMSRAHPNYLVKLLEKEVPEIYEGVIKVVAAAREPGQRAKIAVYSTDSAVHPVGACVGMKGSRIQNITQELKGERVDVIIWEEDPVRFVCNALAPANITKVLVNEEDQEMEVVVANDQLSLAIGSMGQNVRLATNLTKWKLNIISLSEFEERKRKAMFNLQLLPGLTDTMAENIYQCGVVSFQELAKSSVERIKLIPGYEEPEKASALINSAKNLVAEYKGKEIPTAPKQKAKKATPVLSAKAEADQKLKEELAQLEKAQPKKPEKPKPEKAETQKTEAQKPAGAENKEPTKNKESKTTPAENKEPTKNKESKTTPAESKEPTKTTTPAENKEPTKTTTPAENKEPTKTEEPKQNRKS